MTKKIDGRTAKGLRIKQQVEHDILTAYIDLIRTGIPTPTARETAQRARLSLRVIFKHFRTLSELRFAAISRIETQSRRFYAQPIRYDEPAERRRLVTNLHVVCAWPSWETLRAHHELPLLQARRLVTRMALSILRDAFSHVKKPPTPVPKVACTSSAQ